VFCAVPRPGVAWLPAAPKIPPVAAPWRLPRPSKSESTRGSNLLAKFESWGPALVELLRPPVVPVVYVPVVPAMPVVPVVPVVPDVFMAPVVESTRGSSLFKRLD
jgi:hypothetical protein